MNRKDTDILKLDVHEITQWMQHRSSETLPEWMQQYIDWMEMARDFYYKNKSEAFVVKHLMGVIKDKTGKKVSKYVARKVFADAINFFYANMRIRKQAWRSVLAEKLYLAALAQYDEGDYEGFGKNIDRMKFFLELDKPDEEGANKHLLDRRPIVYYTNPEDIGIERVSRNELGRLIDTYDIREAERLRIKREAGVLERRLFPEQSIEDVKEILEDGEDKE